MLKNINVLSDEGMDTRTGAAYIGLSVKTVAMKRWQGTGPKFIKVGASLLLPQRLGCAGRATSPVELAKRKTARSNPIVIY